LVLGEFDARMGEPNRPQQMVKVDLVDCSPSFSVLFRSVAHVPIANLI
jgi:hypothetical protein